MHSALCPGRKRRALHSPCTSLPISTLTAHPSTTTLRYAWLSICEVSTPFLNARWFLAVSNKKHTLAYKIASALLGLTFVATRCVGYALGLYDLYASYPLWAGAPRGLHLVVAGCVAGFGLNLVWTPFVVSSTARALRGGGGRAAAPQKTPELVA